MKLRLPNKLIAAILAAATPALFSTLSTATLGAAAVATLSQQAVGELLVDSPETLQVDKGDTYTSTEETPITIKVLKDTSAQSNTAVSDFSQANYTVFSNAATGNGSRYKIDSGTQNLNQAGTLILGRVTYTPDEAEESTSVNSGQMWITSARTVDNALILGAYGYSEGSYDGVMRINANTTFSGAVTLVDNTKVTLAGGEAKFTGAITGSKGFDINSQGGSISILGSSAAFDTLHQNGGNLEIGDTTHQNITTATRIELGDGQGTGNPSGLHVAQGSLLKLTGSSDNSDYKQATFILGEWEKSTTATIDGSLFVQSANVRAGDTGGVINIGEKGILAAKGIRTSKNGDTRITVNVNGTVLLGSDGINNQTLNLKNGATLGLYANQATISGATTVDGAASVDVAKWAFAEDGNSVAHASSGTSTVTFSGGITINEDAALAISGGGEVKLTGRTLSNRGSIAVHGSKLTLEVGYDNQSTAGDASHTTSLGNIVLDEAELYNGSNCESAVRNIDTLTVDGSSTLTQASWNTFWNIGTLNKGTAEGARTLTWKTTTTHWTNSVLSLNGAGDFDGTLHAERAYVPGVNDQPNGQYQGYVEINHADALKNAVLETQGKVDNAGNVTSYMTVALNSDTVNLAGLRGDEYSILIAGEANKENGSGSNRRGQVVPTSTDTSELIITGKENSDDTFAGKVESGISITKAGAGAQTLSGDMSAFNGSATINGGKLAVTAASTATKGTLNNITIGQGATLELQNVLANTATGDTNKQKLQGNLIIGSGAVFTVTQTDSLNYSASQAEANTITVQGGGELSFDSNRWTVGTNNKIVMAGGTISGQGEANSGALDFYTNGAVVSTTANSEISAAIRLRENNNTTTFSVDTDKELTVSGRLLGSGALLKTGNGSLKVTGAWNDFSGDFRVTEGKLTLQHETAQTSSANLKLDKSGTIELGGAVLYKFNGLFTVDSGTADANAHLNIADGTTLQLTQNGDSIVFAAHGESVNIDGRGKFIIDSKKTTIESIDGTQTAHFRVPLGTHTGTGYYTYRQNSNVYEIANAKLSINDANAVTINNRLTNTDVVNTGTGKLTLEYSNNTVHGLYAENGEIQLNQAGNSASTLKSIRAEGGNVTIQGLGSAVVANLNELTIAGSKTVSAYTGTPTAEQIAAAQNGSNTAVEATLAISDGTLTAGSGAKLNAHLSLGNNTTLNIADATVGGAGLTMGSTVTFEQGAKMKLSDDIINGLNGLITSQAFNTGLTLFSGVDSFFLGTDEYDSSKTYAATDFFILDNGNGVAVTRPWDFVVKFGTDAAQRQSGSGQSIFLYMETPEPATATLSLLALAALAARRKRK